MDECKINVGTLLINKKDDTYWRIIAIENGCCEMIQCHIDKGNIIVKSLTDVLMEYNAKTLVIAENQERGALNRDSLSEEALKKIDLRLEFLNEVDNYFGADYSKLFSKTEKKELLDLIEKYGMSKSTAFRLIRRWLQSGKQDCSVIHQGGSIGSPVKKKMGRPTDSTLDEKTLEAFEFGRKQFLNLRNISKRRAYEDMIAVFYINPKAGQEGEPMFSPDMPSARQFYYYLAKTVSAEKLQRKKTSDREYENDMRLLWGRPAKEAVHPGDIVECDAVETDLYIVSTTDRSQLIGRPVCYMMVDLYSHTIVAASVSLENNSNIGLSNLILNLFDDKDELAAKSGVTLNSSVWPSKFLPKEIRCDRGSDFAGDMFLNLCKDLRIERTLEEPGKGSMKGTIEQCFRLYHNMFRSDFEHKGLIEKRYDSDHKEMACMTIEDFRLLVYLFVLYHNQYYSFSMHYTKELSNAKVPKIPIEIWRYGVKVNGNPRIVNESQLNGVIFNIMPTDTATITREGIKYKNLFYTPKYDDDLLVKMAKAKANANKYDSNGNKLNQMQIRFDPRSVSNLYYLNKDNTVMKLYLNVSKSGSYLDMTWNEYLDYRRSEKEMDKKYGEYNLALNISKNQIVHSIAESVSPGTVIKTGVREARKAENAMINKDNAISSRIITEADNLLQDKTDDEVNEVLDKPVKGGLTENKDQSVPGLLSDTVPDIFKELIK